MNGAGRHSQPHTPETRAKIAESRRRKYEERCQIAYCERCKAPTMPRDLVKSKGRWTCPDCLCPPLPELDLEWFARAPSNAGQMEEVGVDKR